jgi:hypothetical protein
MLLQKRKKDVFTYKQQYPGATQQNIANRFPLYGVNPLVGAVFDNS